MRMAGNTCPPGYSVEAMKKGLTEQNYHFTLFGGEPLLTPIDDLEELWRWGLEKFKQNGIQTSGSCITEEHFELFDKYKVSVGISIDGPGELNDIRWAGTLEKTRETTESSSNALHRLLAAGKNPSIIVTLSMSNASPDRLETLLNWFCALDEKGLRHVNLHLMEIDDPEVREEWALSPEESADALLACSKLQPDLQQLTFQPIEGITKLLLGDDEKSSCQWNACDPYTTRAVRGVGADGGKITCSRSNKAGVDMQKADVELLVRPIALYHTPQSSGGCQGCIYWYACKGLCPGEAIDRDWRKRTEHCETLQIVFGEFSERLASLGLEPISKDEKLRGRVEKRLLESYASGKTMRIHEALKTPPAGCGTNHRPGEHGDTPHEDGGHGDHTDSDNPVVTHGDSG